MELGVGCSWGYHNAGERMLFVKVWGLAKHTEELLRNVHIHIVEAAVLAEMSPIKTENDMMVMFPQDLMEYKLDGQILVEISSSPSLSARTLFSLARKIGQALQAFFPMANVECHHISYTNSFWSSSEEEASGIPS